MKTPIFIFF